MRTNVPIGDASRMTLSNYPSYWHHSRQVSWPLYPAQNRHIFVVPGRTLSPPKLCIKAYRRYGAPSLLRLPYIASDLSRSRTEKFPKNFSQIFRKSLRTHPQNPPKPRKTGGLCPKLRKTPDMLPLAEIFPKIFSKFFSQNFLTPRALASIGDASKCALCWIARNFSQIFFSKKFWNFFNLYVTPPVRS